MIFHQEPKLASNQMETRKNLIVNHFMADIFSSTVQHVMPIWQRPNWTMLPYYALMYIYIKKFECKK